jgi:hypothetical protein
MEAATDAPAERTVDATEPALEDTVLRQDDMIRSELGSSPFLPPFPRLILPPPRATRRSAAPAPTNRSLQPLPTDPAAAHPRSPPPARPSPIPYQFQTAPVDPPTLEPATQLATTISVLPPRRRSSRPSFPSDSNQNRKPTTPWLLPFLFPSSLSALSLSLSHLAVAFVCLSPSLAL